MTLLTLLLVLAWERLFKHDEYWQLDYWLERPFSQLRDTSLAQTLILTLCWMLLVAVFLRLTSGWLYSVPQLLLWTVLGLLCIGAGRIRRYYRDYLIAASRGDGDACSAMSEQLALIHGFPVEGTPVERLRELQNALLWINFRFYLAPLFWLVIGGSWGPVFLAGYAFLRAWQTWLVRRSTPMKRACSGIDLLLHWLDWIPVRLAGAAYALLEHDKKARIAWFFSLWDIHSSQYQVLTWLAQFALHNEGHLDAVQTPRIAVSLAKKVTLMIVIVLLTIYGVLM